LITIRRETKSEPEEVLGVVLILDLLKTVEILWTETAFQPVGLLA